MQVEYVKAFTAAMLALSNMGQAGKPTVNENLVSLNGIHTLRSFIRDTHYYANDPQGYGEEITIQFAGPLLEDDGAEETYLGEYRLWYDQLKDLPIESIKHVYPNLVPVITHLEGLQK